MLSFVDEEVTLIKIRTQQAESLGDSTKYISILSALISAIIVGFLAYIIIQSVLKQVGGEPHYIDEVTRLIAEGDLSITLANKGNETRNLCLHDLND